MMKYAIALSIIAILLFAGCASQGGVNPPPINNSTDSNNSTGGIGMPNPASKFCVDAGYKNEIRTSAAGAQTGHCLFPNGRECEEWAFYRAECTDIDSFELVESPGFVMNPVSLSYKFYADGRLTLTETHHREGNTSTLVAWLKPSEFAAFMKAVNEKGFGKLDRSYYETCNGGQPCPTDMPSFSLAMVKQGEVFDISVYSIADRPGEIDEIVADLKKIVEKAEFVENADKNCTLMQHKATKQLGCFGCTEGISNPICVDPSPDFTAVNDSDGIMGSCTINAAGACAYQPPQQLTQKLCESSGGNWNECGSACRGAPEGTACTLQCVPMCECGGLVGFDCPTGYFCTDYLPKGAMDPMGICARTE